MNLMKALACPLVSLFIILTFTIPAAFASEVDVEPGNFGADVIFVQPIGAHTENRSVRGAIAVQPVNVNTTFGSFAILSMDATISTNLSTGAVELDKIRATAIRAAFAKVLPVNILSFYRDMDRAIEMGVDVIGLRVPIRLTETGEIIIMPGVDLGVRHYGAGIDQTAFNASFVIEARAALFLVRNVLSTGVIGKVQYDLNTTSMSGFSEQAMGYVSLLLDRDHRLYARAYVGMEHEAVREEIGLPTFNIITGLGLYGNFGK